MAIYRLKSPLGSKILRVLTGDLEGIGMGAIWLMSDCDLGWPSLNSAGRGSGNAASPISRLALAPNFRKIAGNRKIVNHGGR